MDPDPIALPPTRLLDNGVRLAELGSLVVITQGQTQNIKGSRAHLVLVLLALNRPDGQSIDSLVELVWPNKSRPATARQSLSNIVGRLRTVLGPGAILTEGGRYRLQTSVGSDRQLFLDGAHETASFVDAGHWSDGLHRSSHALSLWRGDAWAGIDDVDAINEDRRFLHSRRSTLLSLQAMCLAELGQATEAIEIFKELAKEDPWHEGNWLGLVDALREAGQRTSAMRAVADARSALSDAGMTLGPGLAAAEDQLLQDSRKDQPAVILHVPHKLPKYWDEFIGRADELTMLKGALTHGRLITLVGPGGVGKTRLAVEAAAQNQIDQVSFVDFAKAGDPSRVPSLVAEAVGLVSGSARQVADSLQRHLSQDMLLLLLDNCEHLVESVSEMASHILDLCPGVTLLTTSREATQLRGELVIPVLPLPAERQSTDDLNDTSPALQLLLARAKATNPSLDLLANREAADRICQLVDGLPLAIELAAGRLRTLAPPELAERLDGRLSLLASRRPQTRRHRSVEAVIEWSYDLLSEDEKLAFDRLSVFVGGFTIQAAEAVVVGDGIAAEAVVDLVLRLADRSLVVPDQGGVEPQRFSQLMTLRAFAIERHSQRGDCEVIRLRHLTWALGLVANTESSLRTPGQDAALARVVPDFDNLRTARSQALTTGRFSDALRITASVPLDASRTRKVLLEGFLASAPDAEPKLVAHSLYSLAGIDFDLGAFTTAAVHAQTAALQYQNLDEQGHSAYAQMLGAMAVWGEQKRTAQVPTLLETALDTFTRLGDEMGQGYVAFIWSYWLVSNADDLKHAAELADRSHSLFKSVGSPFGLAHAEEAAAQVASADNRPSEALAYIRSAIGRLHEQSNKSCLAHAIDTAAVVKARSSHFEEAAMLLGAAQRLHEEAGTVSKPWETGAGLWARNLLQGADDPSTLPAMRRRGHESDLTEIIAMVDNDPLTRR